jgi:hypothetical protein
VDTNGLLRVRVRAEVLLSNVIEKSFDDPQVYCGRERGRDSGREIKEAKIARDH